MASFKRRVHKIATEQAIEAYASKAPAHCSPALSPATDPRWCCSRPAGLLDRVEDLADVVVHLGNQVGEEAAAAGGLTGKLRVNKDSAGAFPE